MDKLPMPKVLSSQQDAKRSQTSTAESGRLKKLKEYTQAATRLFESYPKSDYDDAKSALASYVTVLSGYSMAIVNEATSLSSGIQRVSKFPPRISELVEFCDKIAERLERYRHVADRQQQAYRQIEDRSHRPSGEELMAKYGAGGKWLPSPPPETWAAIPEKPRQPPPPKSEAKLKAMWNSTIELYQNHPERMQRLTAPSGAHNADPKS